MRAPDARRRTEEPAGAKHVADSHEEVIPIPADKVFITEGCRWTPADETVHGALGASTHVARLASSYVRNFNGA